MILNVLIMYDGVQYHNNLARPCVYIYSHYYDTNTNTNTMVI